MEIVGGLIQLNEKRQLPLPWHVRAFLGLQTGALAYLMISKPDRKDQPPDIIVSPINLRMYQHCRAITVDHDERPGSFAELLRALVEFRDLNIAIADTVTIESRARHRVNLVIEPSRLVRPDEVEGLNQDFAELEADLCQFYGAEHVTVAQLQPFNTSMTISDYRVSGGYIGGREWHDKVASYCRDHAIEGYDTDQVVISGNTEGRFIRYIFPRVGVMEVTMPHTDAPGMLHQLAEAAGGVGLNILSSRLSRAAPPGRVNISQFVAVVEPADPHPPSDRSSRTELATELEKRDTEDEGHDILPPVVRPGALAEHVRYLPPPNSHTVFMPAIFEVAAREAQEELHQRSPGASGRPIIFLCHRFFGDERSPKNRLIREIKTVLGKHNIQYLEANENVVVERTYDYIHSRLWLSSGCLVLAFDAPDEHGNHSGKLSVNQTHEIGFMQAQNKPFKVIVSQARLEQAKFANVPDHSFLAYRDDATAVDCDKNNSDWIGRKLSEWLTSHFGA